MNAHRSFVARPFVVILASIVGAAGCAAPTPLDEPGPGVGSVASAVKGGHEEPVFVLGEHVHKQPLHSSHQVQSGNTPGPAGAHLTYYGGAVLPAVKVVAVFWGPNVNSTVRSGIGAFYGGVTNSAHFDWLQEYNTTINAANGSPGSNQTIGRGTFAGNYAITPSNPATSLLDSDIQTELNNQINAGVVPAPDANTLYMIHFPPGVRITHGTSTSCANGGFCAYHGTFTRNSRFVAYGVIPDFGAGSGCDVGCGSAATMFQNLTATSSHELIEAVTDPEVGIAPNLAAPLAWYDNTNGEIGDICNHFQDTILGGNGITYTVQQEWSNSQNACVTTVAGTTPPPPPPSTSVTNGGFETGNLSGWTSNIGSLSVVGTTPHGGSYAAQVGSTGAYNGDSTISQTIAVSATGTTSLSFWYQPHTGDTVQYDQQQAQVRDTNGATLITLLNVCSNSGAWTQVTADLTPYKGTNVVLWFNDHDDGYAGDPTYYLLDDVSVTNTVVAADTQAPTTQITSPAAGTTVSGTVTVTATASDNVGVTRVEIYVDATLLGSGASSPANASWNTAGVANGAHTLTSKAYDAAGNVGTSATVGVNVSNAAGVQVVTNGGFEGSLTGWTLSGAKLPILSTIQKHTGNNSMRLGANSAVGQVEPRGDSTGYQAVAIPANATTATLTFWYFPYTTDAITADWQDAQVRNANGATLINIFHLASNAQVWTQKTVDVSAYKGQTIQLWFNCHGDGGTNPTTLWIDDVSLITK